MQNIHTCTTGITPLAGSQSHDLAQPAMDAAELLNDEDDLPPCLVTIDDPVVSTPNDVENDNPACPVTILSGFLGAGKTTLVQYILKADHGKRIAVIENEFGGGVDSLSVESLIARDGMDHLPELIELPNGCVCCTVKDSLVVTIENLLNNKRNIDYILIESSGMANPGPIASIFWLDDALQSRIRLDGIVTVVDAMNIGEQLKETFEASQQIAYADRIILNKVDLLPNAEATDKVESAIRRIHPTALLKQASYAAIPDLGWILDASCYDQAQAPNFVSDLDCCHTAFVSTITLYRSAPITLSSINRWLAEILWPDQDIPVNHAINKSHEGPSKHIDDALERSEIYRMKGLVYVQDEDRIEPIPHIVQAVYDLWEVYPAKSNIAVDEAAPHTSKLILIGRKLDEKALRDSFTSLE